MKIAVVTDSNSGMTQETGKQNGIYILPMPFIIDGKTYYEDIDFTQKEFFERLAAGDDISTSQPSPESVMKLWDKLLKDYDAVVHIPMSSGLSGSCQTAMMLADEYDGKVYVVDNQRVSVTQKQSAIDAVKLAADGKTAAEIKEILERTKFDSTIYITLDTLKYLKKGGRITPAAAALGTLLKIKPVLTIQGEKLDAYAKARTMKQAKSMMMAALASDLNKRLGDIKDCRVFVVHTENDAAAAEFKSEIEAEYPGINIETGILSLSIACHIGPGSLALACTKNID